MAVEASIVDALLSRDSAAAALNEKEMIVVTNHPNIPSEIFDVSSGLWRLGPKIPYDRTVLTSPAAVSQIGNGKLIVTGRRNAVLDIRALTDGWSDLPTLQTPRYDHAAVHFEGRYIVVMGGYGSSEVLASVEVLDMENPNLGWAYASNLTSPLAQFGAVVVGDHIVIAGGINFEREAVISFLDAPSLINGEKTPWTDLPNKLSIPRTDHGLVVGRDGASLLAVGGRITLQRGAVGGNSRATASVERIVSPSNLSVPSKDAGWHPLWCVVVILFLSHCYLYRYRNDRR